MRDIAKDHGYNLVIHGSMNRDCDLIAIPWVDNPRLPLELVNELSKMLTGHIAASGHEKDIYMIKSLPGGRTSFVINLNRGGYKKPLTDPPEFIPDPEYYLDISFTPLP
jgi:hypothetical protein